MPVGQEGSSQDAPYAGDPHQRNTLLGLQSSSQHRDTQIESLGLKSELFIRRFPRK